PLAALPTSTLFPYTTLFRSDLDRRKREVRPDAPPDLRVLFDRAGVVEEADVALEAVPAVIGVGHTAAREHACEDLRPRRMKARRSEEHTSELQSPDHLVCRL